MATKTTPAAEAAVPPTEPTGTTVEDRNKLVRQHVLAKLQTERPLKVDIKPVGPNRFRVNAWQSVEGNGVVSEKRIVESFYHVE